MVLALPPAQAGLVDAARLATLPPASGSAVYALDDGPGLQLVVTELDAATMSGSDGFGYEGLWLGQQGNGGRYTLQFSQPVYQLSLALIALTAQGEDGAETLDGWATDAPTGVVFSSADGSAAWAGGSVLPLDEDSRALLQFSAQTAGGFTSLQFSHHQPLHLNGFVVTQIGYTLQPVPEPAAGLLLAAGLAGLAWRRRGLRKMVASAAG